MAENWLGGSLPEGEGAVVFQLLLNRNLIRYQIDKVLVKLYLPAKAMHYSIVFRPELNQQGTSQAWRLPPGNFKLQEVEFRSSEKPTYRWLGNGQQGFTIQEGKVTNFGRWYAIALPKQQVQIIFREALSDSPSIPSASPNLQARPSRKQMEQPASSSLPSRDSAREAQAENRSLTQGGRPLANPRQAGSSASREKQEDLRAIYRYQRKLDLIYSVSVIQNNRLSQLFVDRLKQHDGKLRQCFLDRFDEFDTLQGLLRFRYVFSGNEQLIKNLVLLEDTMGDKNFVECIYWLVLGIRFPSKANLIGEMSFQFQLQTH